MIISLQLTVTRTLTHASKSHIIQCIWQKRNQGGTHWRVGTIPEGCFFTSTGWLPSNPWSAILYLKFNTTYICFNELRVVSFWPIQIRNREHRKFWISIVYESSSFVQISLQRRIIEQLTATTLDWLISIFIACLSLCSIPTSSLDSEITQASCCWPAIGSFSSWNGLESSRENHQALEDSQGLQIVFRFACSNPLYLHLDLFVTNCGR